MIYNATRQLTLFIFVTAAFAATPPKLARFGHLRSAFEENAGQAPPGVRFIARDQRGTVSITRTGVTITLQNAPRNSPPAFASINLRFPGANWSNIAGEVRQTATTNFITGNDSAAWRTGVRNFGAVRIKQAYAGIDIVFHSKRGSIEFDYELQPGADPALVRLQIDSHDPVIAADGSITVSTPAGGLLLPKPVAFQPGGKIVSSHFVRRASGQFGIKVGHYDRTLPLIIDPVIGYLTYHGGSASEIAGPIVLDAAGNMYVVGVTTSSNFPVSANAVQRTAGGGLDGFISKFAPNGTLVYSTILGGADIDLIQGIAVDSQGSAYFCGSSLSSNFPLANAIQTQNKGGEITGDVVFGKLNPTGSALVYSSFYGGNYDDTAYGCVIDPDGNFRLPDPDGISLALQMRV